MSKKYDIAQRIQAFTFLSTGIIIEDVGHITGYSQSALFNLKKRAKERGCNLFVNPIIHDMHIENTFKNKRSGIRLEK